MGGVPATAPGAWGASAPAGEATQATHLSPAGHRGVVRPGVLGAGAHQHPRTPGPPPGSGLFRCKMHSRPGPATFTWLQLQKLSKIKKENNKNLCRQLWLPRGCNEGTLAASADSSPQFTAGTSICCSSRGTRDGNHINHREVIRDCSGSKALADKISAEIRRVYWFSSPW